MKSDQPKIFGDGDVTICLSQDKIRLFVGQKEIKNINSISFDSSDNNHLEIFFPNPQTNENLQIIEEDIRVCALVPWIIITKEQ
jgi:hypothetical protein